jgi:hypothetical protein
MLWRQPSQPQVTQEFWGALAGTVLGALHLKVGRQLGLQESAIAVLAAMPMVRQTTSNC